MNRRIKSFNIFKSQMDEKFRSLLSAIKQPLLGLEFLIYLDDACDGSNESNFYCSLCSKFGNIKNMIQHIKSSSHVLMFLKTMIPDVVEAFNFPLFMNSRGSVESGGFLEMLAKEVEIEFGRGSPKYISLNNVSLKNKWKACFVHLNEVLCSRKVERKVVKNLIKRVQRKRAELKSKKIAHCQEKSQHLIRNRSSKPCKQHLNKFSSNENRPRFRVNVAKRSWSRSPLKNRTENLQRKRRRERSSSEDRNVQPW